MGWIDRFAFPPADRTFQPLARSVSRETKAFIQAVTRKHESVGQKDHFKTNKKQVLRCAQDDKRGMGAQHAYFHPRGAERRTEAAYAMAKARMVSLRLVS